jgi:hypothetical protein
MARRIQQIKRARTLPQRDGRIYRAKKIFKKVGLLVGRFFDKRSAAEYLRCVCD